MKKLILSLLLFTSCGYEAALPDAKIYKISLHKDNLCLYTLDKSSSLMFFSVNKGWFIDTCGKFNVGDIVKYTK